jgi:DNA adenine methylase
MDNIQGQPFLKWAGGKRRIVPAIESILPDNFQNYYEPFLGGGALFAYLHGSGRLPHRAYLSDISEPLMLTYKMVKIAIFDMEKEAQKDCYIWRTSEEMQEKYYRNRDRYNKLKLKGCHSAFLANHTAEHNIPPL